MSKKMEEVKECEVPVVNEDYLEASSKGGALLHIPGSTISDWGAPRHALPVEDEDFFGGGKSFKSKGKGGGGGLPSFCDVRSEGWVYCITSP